MLQVPELESWLTFFRSRRQRGSDLPWADETPLAPFERECIARSIATFQLGESSEGLHLIATARGFAERHELAPLGELTELFVREEQYHAALLAAFMKPNEIPLLRRQWSDRVFRSLRHLAGFELAIRVLLVAELIALTYYRALAAATGSAVLRHICDVILSDEHAHVAYESTLLQRVSAGRWPLTRAAASGLHRLLYAGAIAVVFAGHRSVLRAGGYGFAGFFASCWRSFSEYLGPRFSPVPAPASQSVSDLQ
jgi:hypothetical protein